MGSLDEVLRQRSVARLIKEAHRGDWGRCELQNRDPLLLGAKEVFDALDLQSQKAAQLLAGTVSLSRSGSNAEQAPNQEGCGVSHTWNTISSPPVNELPARPVSAPTPDSSSQGTVLDTCSPAPSAPLLTSLSMQQPGVRDNSPQATTSGPAPAGEPGAVQVACKQRQEDTGTCAGPSQTDEAGGALDTLPSQDDVVEREMEAFREAVRRGDYKSIPASYWARYGVPRDREGALLLGCTVHQEWDPSLSRITRTARPHAFTLDPPEALRREQQKVDAATSTIEGVRELLRQAQEEQQQLREYVPDPVAATAIASRRPWSAPSSPASSLSLGAPASSQPPMPVPSAVLTTGMRPQSAHTGRAPVTRRLYIRAAMSSSGSLLHRSVQGPASPGSHRLSQVTRGPRDWHRSESSPEQSVSSSRHHDQQPQLHSRPGSAHARPRSASGRAEASPRRQPGSPAHNASLEQQQQLLAATIWEDGEDEAVEMLAVGDLSPGDLLGEDCLELVPLTTNTSGSSRIRTRSPLGRPSITHITPHTYDLVTPLASRPVSAGSRPSSGHHGTHTAAGPHRSPVPPLTGLASLAAASNASGALNQQASYQTIQGPVTGGRSSSPVSCGTSRAVPLSTSRPASARESSAPTWMPTSSASARRPHSSPPRRSQASSSLQSGPDSPVQQPAIGGNTSRPSSALGSASVRSKSRGRPASAPPLWLQQQLGLPQFPEQEQIKTGAPAPAAAAGSLLAGASLVGDASKTSSGTNHLFLANNIRPASALSKSAGLLSAGLAGTSSIQRPASAGGTPQPHHQPFQPKIHTYRPASAGRGRQASSDGSANRLFQPTIAFLGKCHSQPSSLRPHPTHPAGVASDNAGVLGRASTSGSQASRTPVVIQLLPKQKDGVVLSKPDPSPITVWQ